MPNIKDVAARAGVGINTVSRVINNRPGVKAETRARILDIIKQLDYVPNEVARNFRNQTSNVVAFFVPFVSNPYLAKVTASIEHELHQRDLKMMLCNSDSHSEKELAYLNIVRKEKVLGIIGITYNDVHELLETNVPFVSIDRFLGKKIPCVAADNFMGGRLALRELVQKGCKRIAMIGDAGVVQSEVRHRRRGFKYEADELGIDVIFHEKRNTIGYSHNNIVFIDKLFDKVPDVDGVFAVSDLLAASVIERATKKGIHVPSQLKVVGFDGIQDNPIFSPYLSTIVQPVEQIAKTAVEILLEKIENPKLRSDVITIPVAYRQGDTT
jgi:LacI family transcriptional regulator